MVQIKKADHNIFGHFGKIDLDLHRHDSDGSTLTRKNKISHQTSGDYVCLEIVQSLEHAHR